ncbi:DoxX family protein [Streptomyces sp. NPDC048331]|uniref:DoxX family protein n=1 Tax=Streptomyces sp. NPDC048331 TaxID=3365534 RepID=UPI00371372EC
MNVGCGVVVGPFALFCFYAGALRVIRGRDRLRPLMGWVDRMPLLVLRVLGVVEVLGAAGPVLSRWSGIVPWSAVVAAAGFVLLQIGTVVVRLTGGDRRIALDVGLVAAAAVAVRSATWS